MIYISTERENSMNHATLEEREHVQRSAVLESETEETQLLAHFWCVLVVCCHVVIKERDAVAGSGGLFAGFTHGTGGEGRREKRTKTTP